MSAIEYASRISMSGLRVLTAYFTKLKQPLRVEDLSVMGMARYEDVAVNKAFKYFLKPFAVRHYSVTALNLSSLIPHPVKVLVKQDVRGRRLKRKSVKISQKTVGILK